MTAFIKRRRVNDPYLSRTRMTYEIVDDYVPLNWNSVGRFCPAMLFKVRVAASNDLY